MVLLSLIYLLYMAPSRVRIETTTLHVSIILLFEPIEYICDLLIQCSTAHLLPGNCQAPYLFLILNRTERKAKGPFFIYVDQILSINDLPLVDIGEEIPLFFVGKICISLTLPVPPTYLILSTYLKDDYPKVGPQCPSRSHL